MSQIKILSENLANKIAAGEVVERPASVIKELVENAIDSGANTISVQVEGDGTRLLRVIDDGCGMDQDDLLLCLERHATSKLQSQEQLSAIETLGFRGEAIPSIASVSKMSITSRIKSETLGNRVDINFGSIRKVHEMGTGIGTMVEVRNLFGNVPARRKFLKSAQTEVAHIDEIVRAYSLGNSQIGFSYQVNGKSILDLPANDTGEERIRKVLGISTEMIPVLTDNDPAEPSDVQVYGYLVPPDNASGKSAKLWVFVNGRNVKDRMLNHAVAEGFHGFIMKGRRGAGVLMITMPPDKLDVNVHPTKQEVRFQQANKVHTIVSRTVRNGMVKFQDDVKFSVFGGGRQQTAFASPVKPQPFLSKEPESQAYKPRKSIPQQNVFFESEPLNVKGDLSPKIYGEFKTEYEVKANKHQASDDIKKIENFLCQKEEYQLLKRIPDLRYIGQLFDSYILCEVDDGFVAIDQHAAQERLIFEELLQNYNKQEVPSQILMFPEMLEFTPAQIQVYEQNKMEFRRLGLDIQGFGGESFVVKSVPASLSHMAAVDIVMGILDSFVESEFETKGKRVESIIAGMACKASIKAGHNLKAEEAKHLLLRMQEAGIFSHCPHGRPVFKRFSSNEVKKWFHRT